MFLTILGALIILAGLWQWRESKRLAIATLIIGIPIFLFGVTPSAKHPFPTVSPKTKPSAAAPVAAPTQPVISRREITIANIKASAITPSYDDMARYPDKYRGQSVVFIGKVVQVIGSGSRTVARINITQGKYGWNDTIWVNVSDGTRVLEKDLVKLWGTISGEREYTAVLGQKIHLPEVDAVVVDVLIKAGDQR